jgi:type II secretory pathway pseudopilin PulG
MKGIKGFTIIETVVVAVIASFVGLGVVSAIAVSTRILNENYRQAMAEATMTNIMSAISRDVKSGYSLISDEDGETLSITGLDGTVTWSAFTSTNPGKKITTMQRKFTPVTGNSTTRTFTIFDSSNSDKSVSAVFTVNPHGIGKYNSVLVKVTYATGYYENKSVENHYHCRLQESGHAI